MTTSCSSDVHSVTATHAPPSLALEYVMPDAHAAHWRSASAEPALDMPWPIGHVDQAAHASDPTVALKCPVAHAVQELAESFQGNFLDNESKVDYATHVFAKMLDDLSDFLEHPSIVN